MVQIVNQKMGKKGKNMKKNKMMIMAKVLPIALCTVLLAACGDSGSDESASTNENVGAGTDAGKESEEGDAAEESGTEDSATLTVWVPESIRIEDWNTNDMTLWLEEQGGFDLNIVTLPADGFSEKVNMSLSAGDIGDLPDVILGNFGDSAVWSWAQAGSVVSLTDYYNDPDKTPNIRKAYERTGTDYTKQITSPDGNIYGVATLNQSYGNEYPDKLWIYKPWLDALDREVPTTTEEFRELLKLVSTTDLNGNGKADEIGMAGARLGGSGYGGYARALMNAFEYTGDVCYRTVKDGAIGAAYTTDEWKEGLSYIKEMFSENLILGQSLSMGDDEFKTLINSDEPVVFSFAYFAPDMIASGSDRANEYIAIDTLAGPGGVNYATYRPTVANISLLVTANCKNPEAAFKLGDLMSSEYIGISQRWGKEGVNWDYAENVDDMSTFSEPLNGFEPSIATYDDASFWSGTEVANYSWRQTGPYVRQYGIACGVVIPTEGGSGDPYTENLNAAWILYQTSGHQPEEVIPKLILTEEETKAIGEVESNLVKYVEECWASFVTGSMDIDGQWDGYLEELDKIGLQEYLSVIQTAYDRMYK